MAAKKGTQQFTDVRFVGLLHSQVALKTLFHNKPIIRQANIEWLIFAQKTWPGRKCQFKRFSNTNPIIKIQDLAKELIKPHEEDRQ